MRAPINKNPDKRLQMIDDVLGFCWTSMNNHLLVINTALHVKLNLLIVIFVKMIRVRSE